MTDTLSETGGTFSMGYVDARFMKLLSDDHKNIKEGHYLYPLYDVRHFALAAAIDDLDVAPDIKTTLYKHLLASGTAALVARLADRADNAALRPEINAAIAQLTGASLQSKSPEALREYAKAEVTTQLDAVATNIGEHRKPPASMTAQCVLGEYGLSLDHMEVPYRIDSIDYDMGVHRQKLYDTAAKVFRDGNGHALKDKTFYVIGGTDTQTAYAGLLGRELMADGLITRENGNKVIFLSSMLSFAGDPIQTKDKDIIKHPQHIGRLLKAAVKVRQQENLPGAFILSAADEKVSRLTVHNALDTEKISSFIPDAFRSLHPVGTVTPEKGFVVDPKWPPQLIAPWRKWRKNPDGLLPELTPIAMPLISGNDTRTILATLRKMPDTPIMIEGGIPTQSPWIRQTEFTADIEPSTPITHEEDIETIKDVVRARAERGVPTYFVDPTVYDPIKECVKPLIPWKEWKSSPFLADIKAAGGIVVEGKTNIGAYLDATLALSNVQHVHGPKKIKELTDTKITRAFNPSALEANVESSSFQASLKKERAESAIGLHYVPFAPAVEATLNAVVPEHCLTVLNALPGESLPVRYVPIFKQLKNHPDTIFISAFAYNNAVHEHGGHPKMEGRHRVPYANAQASFSGIESAGDFTAREVLSIPGRWTRPLRQADRPDSTRL